VESYLRGIEGGKRALVEGLRKFVANAAPQLEEKIKWGNLTWTARGNVCWVIVYGDHVDFGFFAGAELKDPKGLLEGTGKKLRHIKVYAEGDIKPREFAALLKQAIALDG